MGTHCRRCEKPFTDADNLAHDLCNTCETRDRELDPWPDGHLEAVQNATSDDWIEVLRRVEYDTRNWIIDGLREVQNERK